MGHGDGLRQAGKAASGKDGIDQLWADWPLVSISLVSAREPADPAKVDSHVEWRKKG